MQQIVRHLGFHSLVPHAMWNLSDWMYWFAGGLFLALPQGLRLKPSEWIKKKTLSGSEIPNLNLENISSLLMGQKLNFALIMPNPLIIRAFGKKVAMKSLRYLLLCWNLKEVCFFFSALVLANNVVEFFMTRCSTE